MRVIEGDCRDVLADIPADSIDAVVTDPPYHLVQMSRGGSNQPGDMATPYGRCGPSNARGGFMNKTWDGGDVAFQPDTWRAVYRVLRPGAHLLAFSGTRTSHRMVCAIEDAGFEIRDTLCWLYGSGFPKSADIAKHIDRQERNRWLEISKAVDSMNRAVILAEWLGCSGNVRCAGLTLARNLIGTGTNTPKSGSAPEPVMLSVNRANSHASVILAELASIGPHPITGGSAYSAQELAGPNITASSDLASNAENLLGSLAVTLDITASFVQWHASGCPDASTSLLEAAVEALTTWLGRPPSSRREATIALYVAVTDVLKHITLSRCSTFLGLDTKSQMDCVSAISATITASTAANLISFTADTLKAKAIDRAAGAAREVIGTTGRATGPSQKAGYRDTATFREAEDNPGNLLTAPATPDAQRWQGWGTALKPAHEPIVLARKPLGERTVAANVLCHGTGAINVDACRVPTDATLSRHNGARANAQTYNGGDWQAGTFGTGDGMGRWPANVLHDGSDEVEAAFAAFGDKSSARVSGNPNEPRRGSNHVATSYGQGDDTPTHDFRDAGSASRFFFCAKADRGDRADSRHPTVKPIALLQWLVRLITPPGGTVLDPFAGSGTTAEAAMLEGFDAILIEKDPASVADIRHRMARWSGGDMPLFAPVPAPPEDARIADLFREPELAP